ncbi:MAG: M23 family metallopeptidase [bacterium]|nr:M23 family metallopeptidase [bacterium]MDZ4295906.1 M23 family metallopeptidase [Patescibacteria group bacterium]
MAKFFDIEGFVPSLMALATSPEPTAFLFQPALGVVKNETVRPMVVVRSSGLVAPLTPVPTLALQGGPAERSEIVTYVVESGDNASSIAAQFGITVPTLLSANNLTERSVLKIGSELIILPVSGVQHKVRSGETIATIAKKYQANIEEIIDFNDLPESGDIFVGDTIIIPGGKVPPPPPPARPGSYPRVTQPQVASGFFLVPASGRNFGRLHSFNGVDIASSCGTPIVAAAAGTVVVADASGWNGGYGLYVRIRHANGVETLYGHLKTVLTTAGSMVGQGDLIGYMGTTGRSTGCHVHFEVRGARNPFAR